MCQVLNIQRSGLYAWLKQPHSGRTLEDNRLLGLIKHSWLESGCVYGYRKVTSDLKDLGERCSKNRVARLMKQETLSAQVGYRRRKGHYHGKPAVVAPNHLNQQFDVAAPNQVWVTDITYIRTHEGWLYLAAVIDLFSRQVVGWSLQSHMQASLVKDALTMAWWRRRPPPGLIFHSDRGSQYCSHEVQGALKDWGMRSSMSRKGNCWDNAPKESFWGRLKTASVHGCKFATREQARQAVMDWMAFYNHRRLHSSLGYLSPMQYEQRWYEAQRKKAA